VEGYPGLIVRYAYRYLLLDLCATSCRTAVTL
jgi:hypothetical protein